MRAVPDVANTPREVPFVVAPTERGGLASIWLCNPSLDGEILPRAEGCIVAYRAGETGRWWDEAGRQAIEEGR
jgi:hypothetical protein